MASVHAVRKPPSGLTGKTSTAKANQAKSNQKALRKYVTGSSFTLKAILALFAINFFTKKSAYLSQREWCLLEMYPEDANLWKEPVTKRQKFSLRTGEHLITRGVLSQSRGRVLKKFPGSFAPRPPSFSTVVNLDCLYQRTQWVRTAHIRSVGPEKFSRSKASWHPPQITFECAPLFGGRFWPKIEEVLVVKNEILYCWHRFRT